MLATMYNYTADPKEWVLEIWDEDENSLPDYVTGRLSHVLDELQRRGEEINNEEEDDE